MKDLINQGMKVEDERSAKRLAIAKNMATLLDVTGVDSMTLDVGGFTFKSERQQYDDEVTKPSVSSPPGMYLMAAIVGASTVNIQAHTSDSVIGELGYAGNVSISGASDLVELASEEILYAEPGESLMLHTWVSDGAGLYEPKTVRLHALTQGSRDE